MLRRILRVLTGFILACLAAAAVTVSFADIQELKMLSADRAEELISTYGIRVLAAATQGAIFAAPIAFVGILIGEWRAIREWTYYTVLALVIALLGFLAWYSAEVGGQITIVNNYAMTAFLTSGFLGGLVYWLFSGRSAGTPVSKRRQNETFERPKQKGAKDRARSKPVSAETPESGPVKLKPSSSATAKSEQVKGEPAEVEFRKLDALGAKPARDKPAGPDPVMPSPEKIATSVSEKIAKSVAEKAATSAKEMAVTSVPKTGGPAKADPGQSPTSLPKTTPDGKKA